MLSRIKEKTARRLENPEDFLWRELDAAVVALSFAKGALTGQPGWEEVVRRQQRATNALERYEQELFARKRGES